MKRYFLLGIIIFLFILFSVTPTLYELSEKDNVVGRTFELVHNYYTDYNFYLSRIREGIEGRWTVVEEYTTEPHAGSLIQVFYLLLGKSAVGFSDHYLGATVAYHGARMLLGAVFLFLVTLLVRKLFTSLLWQILAFLLAVTASGWPIVVPVSDTWRLGGYMSWWTIMDNLQRMTFLPHLLLGQVLIVILLLGSSDVKTLGKPVYLLWLGLAAFILGLVFPPGLVFVGATFGCLIILEALLDWNVLLKTKTRKEWILSHVLPRALIGVVALPSVLYFQFVFRFVPWKRLIELDILHPLPFNFLEYGKALGPTLALGILGLSMVFWKKDKRFIVPVAWVLAWGALLFIFRYIPSQSPLRFSEMAPHVPLGILTAYLFYELWRCCSQNFFSLTAPMLLIVLGFTMMVSSFLWQKDFVDTKVHAGWPYFSMNNYIVYPLTTFTDALSFIEKQTPHDAIILSDISGGNYIPPYTGHTVFVGHDNTFDAERKVGQMRAFYSGQMPLEEAQAWLTKERISYVFFGFQEKENGKLENIQKTYPFLKNRQ